MAGREGLLTELHARLAPSDDPGPRIVVLSGLDGVGKTSVAVEYAHRHLAEVGVVWQFPAEDKTVLAAGFGELAARLGARELIDTRDPVASVHAMLATFPAGWLLIFDNATDMASVAAFLPPAGPGRVLITSQNPDWPGAVLEVPVLSSEVAADFLVSRTGDPDRQAAAELAGELDGLPLALEQTAAYITAAGQSLAGYLALFRQRRPDLLGHSETTGHAKIVPTTWALAFERLQRANPAATGLLRLVAFCAPEAVPLNLLLQQAGNVGRARDQSAGLLPVIERVLGPDHPQTLTIRANVASFTGLAGNAAGARDQYAALLPKVERILGPDHPRTLTIRNNLAHLPKKARRKSKIKWLTHRMK